MWSLLVLILILVREAIQRYGLLPVLCFFGLLFLVGVEIFATLQGLPLLQLGALLAAWPLVWVLIRTK